MKTVISPKLTGPDQGTGYKRWRPTWWRGRTAVIGFPFVWLLLFFLAPFLIVLNYSISDMGPVMAEPVLHWSEGAVSIAIKYANYIFLFQDDLYVLAYLSSLKYAAITTICCLVIGYPFAYFMARAKASVQPVLVMLVMLPFWTSFLLRVYAWKGLLSEGGWGSWFLDTLGLDHLLVALGIINAPGQYLYTPFSLMIGMTYTYLPFMILPLYSNLAKMDLRLLEAAADLGATPWEAFWKVTVPLSKAGIIAGSMLVFIPCIGEYVTPEMLGGSGSLMIGRVLWDEFFSNNDWTMASTVTVVLVLLIIVPLAIFHKYQAEAQEQERR
jgi:putrescine transport system permease protein